MFLATGTQLGPSESLAPSEGARANRPRASFGHGRAALLWAVLGVLLILAAGLAGGRLRCQLRAPAEVHLLNFAVGTIESARFGPDGQTVYYSLRVGGGPPELYVYDPRTGEPRALGVPNAHVLAASPEGDLALQQAPAYVAEGQYTGTLALLPASGGAPRVVREGVAEAVWDGAELAGIWVDGTFRNHLEFPPGRTIDRWNSGMRFVTNLALAKDGKLLACVDVDSVKNATTIETYGRDGGRRVLFTRDGESSGGLFTGLVWGPGGKLWVSEREGDQTLVWTLTLGGLRRVLWRGQGSLQLLDVSGSGRALLVQQTRRWNVAGVKPEGGAPVDLTIQGHTQVRGLSADGREVLLNESPVENGGTVEDRVFVRSVAGGPARALGKGWGVNLSPDGRWVNADTGILPSRDLDPTWAQAMVEAGLPREALGDLKARSYYVLFVPTGPGRPFVVALPRAADPTSSFAELLPDGRRMVTSIMLQGQENFAVVDRQGGPLLPVAPPDGAWAPIASIEPLSPEGGRLIITQDRTQWFIQPLAGGHPEPIRGMNPGERVVGWTADGKALFIRSDPRRLPMVITRLDPATGARQPILSFSPLDPSGFTHSRDALITPDGRHCVVAYQKVLSDLYLVEHLEGGV